MTSISDRLLEGTTDAFISLDPAHRVTFANGPAVRLFSRLFHASLERPGERSLWDLIPPLAESSLHEGCLRAARDQAPVEFEEYFQPPGAWLAVHVFPSREGLSIFCRDVTELRLQRETHRLVSRQREARAEAEAARREAVVERGERDRALALLDAILESTPLGYGILDLELRYVRVNRVLAEMNGLPAEAHPGRTVREVLPEADPRLYPALERVVRSGETVTLELEAPGPDGEARYLTGCYFPIRNRSGELIAIGAHVTDRTAHVNALRAARRARDRYHSLIQVAATIVWSAGPSGHFETEQPGWAAFTGQAPEAYRGPGVWEAVHPEDRARSQAQWLEARRTRTPFVTEYRVRRQDGVYRTMRVRAVPLLDEAGEIQEWVGTHTDVTEQVRAEEALRQREDQLRIALESARLGTWDYNPVTGVMQWSARCKAIFGLPEDAEITYPIFLSRIHPEDREWVDGVIAACIAPQSSGEYDIEYRVTWDDGSVHWVAAKGKGWFAGAGDARHCVRFIGTVLDVTARRHSAEALRESEERLRAALAASRTGTFRWDLRTNALEWDENLDRLFGLEPHQRARSLDQFLALVHPDDRDGVVERCARCRDEGADFDMEFRVVWPDGTIRWLDDKGRTFRDPAGRPAYMTGACVDVTAHKATAAALRESEQRFRTLAEAVPQIVWVTRPDGWHEYYNQRWYQYTGLTEAESIGWGWSTPLHPDDWARSQERWAEATRTGEPYEIEYRFRSAAGEYRWFLGRALPVRNLQGQITRWFGTCTDIHEQRLAQEERQRSLLQEQRRSRQLRLLADAAVAVNAATNQAEMLRLITRSALEIIGARGCAIRVRGAGEAGSDVEVTAPEGARRPADGSLATVEAPLTGQDGGELGTIQLWSKDGERFAEDDHSLLQQVAQLAAVAIEKMRLYEELRRADRAKTEFLAMLAHEIRNPMAPIANAVELLRAGAEDERRERAQEVIRRQIQHMRRLVDDLLDVSRITQGKIELQRRQISLDTVVAQAAEAARPLIIRERHTLLVRMPPTPVWLHADPDRLTQVLINLLNNAAKYTEPGGEIRLEVEVSAGQQEVGREEVVIRVRDNGCGIARGDLERIFGLFAQVERDLARSQGGLGIGLTMVRNLVQMHGGTVSADSEGPGRGSEFTVRLPISSPGPEVQTPQPVEAGVVTGNPGPGTSDLGRGVLVIDDNPDGAETVSELLQLWGYHCVVATNGAAGLELARTERPGVILLDLGLPGMDGFAVAAALRQLPETARTRIVAITGYGDEESRQRTAAAGFDAHLTKPVDPEVLHALLRQLCSVPQPETRGHAV